MRSGQHEQHLNLTKGIEVEVRSDEGWSWFRATILESPPRPTSRRRKQVLVQYNNHKTGPLKEYLDPCYIRPLPPESRGAYEENEFVDAARKDGWYIGVVRKVLDEGRYRVYFDKPAADVIEFSDKDLRPHWDWIDGSWIRPPRQQTVRSIYGSGESVEVKIESKGIYAWFPAVVVREYGDNTFLVKYQSRKNGDENSMMKTIVNSTHIRPSPCFVDRDYELLETVDIRHESGWRQAVVTKVLTGRTYRVFLNQANETKDLDHLEIRPHFDWVDDKWVSQSEKALIVSDIQEQFRVGIANKMGTARDISDGTTPSPVGIRKLIIKSTNSGERSTAGDSAQGPLSTVEPLVDENLSHSGSVFIRSGYNKKIGDVGQSSVITGSSTGRQFRIKEQTFVNMNDEKLETIAKKRRYTKSPVKGPQAFVRDKDEYAVDVAGQDINKKKNVPKEIELSLILGLQAKRSRNPRHSYPLHLYSEKAPKPLQNGQKSLNESVGDTSEKISQLGVGGSQRRKRGRPCKLVLCSDISEAAGKGEYGTAEVVNNLVVKDQIPNAAELPVQMPTEPSASNGVTRETNCTTKEVDMAIVGVSKDMTDDDNQPLSVWIGGMPSSKSGLSTGKSANRWSDAKERQIDLNANGDIVLHEEQGLPFTKNSAVWKTIESLEVFQLVPQNPHFAPLAGCKEEYREGMAIGFMVIFANMFEKIASLQFDSTRSIFEGILVDLLDLEKHGFDISLPQSRVNEMLSIIDTHGELLNKSQSEEKEIREQCDEIIGLTEKISAIEKKITKLQEEATAFKSQMKSKELQISSLQVNVDSMNKSINKAQNDFEKIATAPWN